MTSLPVINKSGRGNRNSSKNKANSRNNVRFMTWKELEALKHQQIRDANPIVTRVDAAMFRNTYKHNLCISMLKSGFHRSFEELFTLIEQRRKQRIEAGEDSILWQERPLDVQEEKLDELWEHLTRAEAADRLGRGDEVYASRQHLAEYFLRSGDIWLSDYFFKSALDTSVDGCVDGGRRRAEANCNIGLARERAGDFEAATNHMEEFYQLSVDRPWVGETGIPHTLAACRHLSRLCTKLAELSKSPLDAQPLLHRSLKMAKEGEDALQVAKAALKLGRNYEMTKDSETAIQYLTETLNIAQSVRDDLLVGQACEGLARSYLTQGNAPRALDCLDLYAKSSRSNELSDEFIEACNCLGKIYNATGVYEKAVEHFEAAYDEVNAVMRNDPTTKVQLGVARGNQMLNQFRYNMGVPERVMMSRIVNWKDQRSNKFGDPLPTSITLAEPSLDIIPDPTQPFRDVESTP